MIKMESEVKKVQQVQLEILQVFKSFCEEHHLRWYMVGGSLIGVFRHKGFIPWDDDIDIGMPRPDYDRFLSLQHEYPKGYTIVNHRNTPEWQFNFSQFVDNESEIVVHMNEAPRKCKIWIDIFPQDGSPNHSLLRWLHVKHIMFYRYLVQIPNVTTQIDTHKMGRPWYEKVIIKLLHYFPIGRFINVDKMLKKMEQSLRKYDYEKSDWVGNYLGKYREKGILPKSWWFPARMMPFENIKVPCPAESEKNLTHFYGDYMQMPPEKKRVSHDIEIIKIRE